MIRAHKIRLNPTTEQEIYFRKAAGTKRFVYNQALDLWKFGKAVGAAEFGMMEIKRQFNLFKAEQYPWIYEIAKDVFEGAFHDLATALKNYFDSKNGSRKDAKVGFPVVRVGRFYASSKACNDCGYVNCELELKDRTWVCLGCGTIHDRDWNAAKNIEQEAHRLAYQAPSEV